MDADLYKALYRGDISFLKGKYSEFAHLQPQLTPKRNTVLHIAAQFGQLACVEWILDFHSCSPLLQQPNLKGDTPLHLAAREGHRAVVEALLDAKALHLEIESGVGTDKAMLRITNKEKDTALHEAVRTGYTPLYMAAEREYEDLVEIIIDTSPSSDHKGIEGRTALHAAVLCRHQAMTKKILGWKPMLIKEVDENGWSPLHCAAYMRDAAITKQLLDGSSQDKSVIYLGIKNSNRTALHIASYNGCMDIVKLLLSHAPDCCEQVDENGNNVFHFAMMKKHPSHFGSELLIKDGLRVRGLVNEKDAQGDTPLHLLASFGVNDVDFILDKTVDKMERNKEKLNFSDNLFSSRNKFSWGTLSALECPQLYHLHERSKEYLRRPFRSSSSQQAQVDDRFEGFKKYSRLPFRPSSLQHVIRKDDSKYGGKIDDDEEEDDKIISSVKKASETPLIVATLTATVTFAAGFTLPGGYSDTDGMAILTKKASFKAFVVSDTIALTFSVSAVFIFFSMAVQHALFYDLNMRTWLRLFFYASHLTLFGMGAMVVAFTTGLYAVLPQSFGFPILTFHCIFSSLFYLYASHVGRASMRLGRPKGKI
ncbi:Ankyrin repeat-containing protein ITN1 [Vitis vinifera]|uniref:Ankyrin repeat-containing protein ITN1 n=1 Tax=Vitis vinifera TaxID=29760 RepID=A0A438FG15_VITVI|nr:Ankyrin repeat-containing protein ITN1 [Vitis vinifera]